MIFLHMSNSKFSIHTSAALRVMNGKHEDDKYAKWLPAASDTAFLFLSISLHSVHGVSNHTNDGQRE
jgi:uncharacterized membrane protein SirB2